MIEPFISYYFYCETCRQMVIGELEEYWDDIFLVAKGCPHWRKGTRIDLPSIEPKLSKATWLLPPKVLKFTSRVLGDKASNNLGLRDTTQTIRSLSEIAGISAGDMVGIALDYRPLGKATITSIDQVNLGDLTTDDANRGGFDTLEDLQKALERAGYRFKPLKEYSAYRLRFQWE